MKQASSPPGAPEHCHILIEFDSVDVGGLEGVVAVRHIRVLPSILFRVSVLLAENCANNTL